MRRDNRDVSPKILIFMNLSLAKKETCVYARECTCVMCAYICACTRERTKPHHRVADMVLRGTQAGLPSSSMCVMCVSDFYLPLMTAILHSPALRSVLPLLLYTFPTPLTLYGEKTYTLWLTVTIYVLFLIELNKEFPSTFFLTICNR